MSTFSAAEKAFNRASRLCPKDTVLLCLLGGFMPWRVCVCVSVCVDVCVRVSNIFLNYGNENQI